MVGRARKTFHSLQFEPKSAIGLCNEATRRFSVPKFSFLLVLPFLCAQQTTAQEASYFIDGNILWNACQTDQPYAYGIISGIHDALSQAYDKTGYPTLQVCAPPNVTVPVIKKAICTDLEQYENLRGITAVEVVWSSMLINYPCP